MRIERRQNPASSAALWVPAFWILTSDSLKGASTWLTIIRTGALPPELPVAEGDPMNRIIGIGLLILALWIFSRRNLTWSEVLSGNRMLVFLYIFMGLSILWAGFPYIAFKRWVRSAETIAMAALIVTEDDPLQAMESILRRCAYILLPLSFMLVKWFPSLSVEYNWAGVKEWNGVALQKNSLGTLCSFLLFYLIWSAYRKWRSGELFENKAWVYADAIVTAMGLYLMRGMRAYSVTAIVVLFLGLSLMFLFYWARNLAEWVMAHLKGLSIFLAALIVSWFSTVRSLATLLGRNATLTGRTDIWNAVVDAAARHPLLGYGFGSFWGMNIPSANHILAALHVREAHCGYLDVYLNMGIAGLIIFLFFLLSVCGKIQMEFERDFDWGVFGLCNFVMILTNNITEAYFFYSVFLWNLLIFLAVLLPSAGHAADQENG